MLAPCCWSRGSNPSRSPQMRSSPSPRQVGFRGIDMLLRACGVGMNVEFEHVSWNCDRHAGIGNIDNTTDATLDRRAAEDDIGLFLRVAEFRQVIDGVDTGPTHRHGRIVLELLSGLVVDADALEHQEIPVVGIDGADLEQWIDQSVFVDPALDQLDMEMDPASHFDRPAEGD